MTNELNKLTGKYLKGVNMDVDMQSFSQMTGTSTETRTTMDVKVSKNLFRDRVTIEAQTSFNLDADAYDQNVGDYYSGFQNDFAIIYDITPGGDYKLKVFDRSAFDIIYKDIRTTGIALIFIKEFDDLFGNKPNEEGPEE